MKQIKLGILLASSILFLTTVNAEEIVSPASDVVYQNSGIDDEQEYDFPCAGVEKVLEVDEEKIDLMVKIITLENENAELKKENEELKK